MTPLRLYSFLGQVARPHYEAVGGIVARAAGFDPLPLEEPSLAELDAVVATPGPALVFLCGLPYVRLRDANAPIEPVAAAVPKGDTVPQYFADMVVRVGCDAVTTADLVGGRIGYNGLDSLSGYVMPYAALMHRELAAALYDDAIETGSHRRSLELLRRGELDAAAIDSTLFALEARADPATAELRLLERLGPAPIPPVVLVNGDAALAARLTEALIELDQHVIGRAALELGLIERFVETSDGAYDPVREMDGAVR